MAARPWTRSGAEGEQGNGGNGAARGNRGGARVMEGRWPYTPREAMDARQRGHELPWWPDGRHAGDEQGRKKEGAVVGREWPCPWALIRLFPFFCLLAFPFYSVLFYLVINWLLFIVKLVL